MRIGFDLRALRREIDGIGRYSRCLIRGLAERHPEHEYVVFALPGTDTSFLPSHGRVEILRIPHRHLSAWTVFRFGRVLEEQRLDLLHIPFFIGPRRNVCPTVVTVHDLMALTFPRFFSGRSIPGECLARAFHRAAVPSTVRRADRILADSEFTRSEVLRVLKTRPDRVAVLYPFLDDSFVADRLPRGAGGAAERFGVSDPYFLFAGNTKPYKNLPGLLRGYEHYAGRCGEPGPAKLLLVGPPDRFRETIARMARQSGLGENVALCGAVSDTELAGLMAEAEAFCFPSLCEGFGYPVLEAMALGTPVICSSAASLPEVAGDCAVYVDPNRPEEIGDAMIRVRRDADLRRRLASNGPLRAGRFDRDETIDRLMECYQRTLRAAGV